MERVHLDLLGPFNISSKGNKYVLGIMDQFSKWLECVPLPDQSAEKIATSAINDFFVILACPSQYIPIKVATLWEFIFKSVCELLEIRKTQTTPYHPENDGQMNDIIALSLK